MPAVKVTITTLNSQLATIAQPVNGMGRLVVFCHGAGTTYDFIADHGVTWPTLRATANFLAARGYVVVTPELIDSTLTSVGQTWGNNSSTTRLGDVVTAAKALPGVSQGKYALVGMSMGGLTVFNHARRLAYAGIAGVLGLIPATDIQSHRGTDGVQGANYAEINNAYSVANDAGWDAIKATYQPANFGANFPFKVGLWTNSNDLVATQARADLLVATNGTWISRTNLGVSAGGSGHDFDLVTPAAVHTWLDGLSW